MGRVRTKTVKRAAKKIVEQHYSRLSTDFQLNKRICDEVAEIPTKKLRNKIAGYVTHLMRRIERGPVPGISIKLQEEERERRDNWVPEVSAVVESRIRVDSTTFNMIKTLGIQTDRDTFIPMRVYARNSAFKYKKKPFNRRYQKKE